MTAIVTGVKTHNGVISQGPDTVRGERDGIETKPTFSHDRQRVLFEGQYVTGPSLANDDISPDGRYFVMLQLKRVGNRIKANQRNSELASGVPKIEKRNELHPLGSALVADAKTSVNQTNVVCRRN
jgi:hypothetical protein